jgi:hypothetical protein
MKAYIRIRMINENVFVRAYDPDKETEEGVMNFLGREILDGNFIDFESGRFTLARDHIVSIESSGLTPTF